MKHEKEIRKCRLRAEASIAQADFIENRCQNIELVCAHSPYEDIKAGAVLACIHVYDQCEAIAAFGADGWIPELNGSTRITKMVDGFHISFDPCAQ